MSLPQILWQRLLDTTIITTLIRHLKGTNLKYSSTLSDTQKPACRICQTIDRLCGDTRICSANVTVTMLLCFLSLHVLLNSLLYAVNYKTRQKFPLGT